MIQRQECRLGHGLESRRRRGRRFRTGSARPRPERRPDLSARPGPTRQQGRQAGRLDRCHDGRRRATPLAALRMRPLGEKGGLAVSGRRNQADQRRSNRFGDPAQQGRRATMPERAAAPAASNLTIRTVAGRGLAPVAPTAFEQSNPQTSSSATSRRLPRHDRKRLAGTTATLFPPSGCRPEGPQLPNCSRTGRLTSPHVEAADDRMSPCAGHRFIPSRAAADRSSRCCGNCRPCREARHLVAALVEKGSSGELG